jgi:signal transduction histidine kinase
LPAIPVEEPNLLPPALEATLKATIREGKGRQAVEVLVTGADGKQFSCECETSALRDARGRISGAMAMCHDLTQQKEMEEQMRRMDRLASVGTLAAGVAHEIKNPLVAIKAFAQLLPERYEDDEFREGFGAVVCDEVTRINRLIHALMDFANPARRSSSSVFVDELIERSQALLTSEAHKGGIEITVECEDSLPCVIGDSEQLHQVFLNLLQNAIQALEGTIRRIAVDIRRTTVRRRDRPPAAGILVQISDTGKGISPQDLQRVFDPFFSRRDDGTGLGLAICHRIVENHGGTIGVDSVEGQGTTFSVVLPTEGNGTDPETAST